MSDSLPMKLSIRGRRVKHKKRKLEVDGVKCSVINTNREPILLLDVETPSCNLKFCLRATAVIKLVGNFTHTKYPYKIMWKMGKLRYKLGVNKLSVVSALIAIN